MQSQDIAKIAASVLYLSGPDDIDVRRSLFSDYGMSSLDFVDFAFEVRAASQKQFQPEALWPVNAMLTDRALYSDGRWTPEGLAALGQLFDGHAAVPTSPTTEALYGLFSVAFVEHRLRAL